MFFQKMGMWVRFVLVLGTAAIASVAAGQDVIERRGSGSSRFLKAAERAAERAGVVDFPKLTEGQPGTIVSLYFDFNDYDIVFTTANTVSKVAAVADAKRFAADLGRPLADFYVGLGTMYLSVDIELNEYLPTGKGPRSVEFDLAQLSRQIDLLKSFPRPVWFVVEPKRADTTIVRERFDIREIHEMALFKLGGPESNATVTQTAEVPWYSIPLLVGLGAVLLLVPISIARRMLGRPTAVVVPEEELLSPEEVQHEYEKNRKTVWLGLLPLLFILPLMAFVMSWFDSMFDKAFRGLPETADPFLALFPFAMFVIIGGAYVLRKVRDKKDPPSAVPIDGETRQLKFIGKLMLIPMFVFLLVFTLRTIFPSWISSLPEPVARALPIVVPLALLLPLIIGSYRLRKQINKSLPTDSVYRQFAIDVASRIGVNVRDVFEIDAPYVSAMATLNGKVGLTKGLLSKMEPQEIRTVIAHEIGHQRAKHVRTFFLRSMLILIVLFALNSFLFSRFPNVHPMLRGPLLILPLAVILPHLLLGKRRRLAEHEADLFAVEVMGDPEIVISTLKKMAHLNQTPMQFVGIDEKLSSHPSVANREKAIREHHRDCAVDSRSGD